MENLWNYYYSFYELPKKKKKFLLINKQNLLKHILII